MAAPMVAKEIQDGSPHSNQLPVHYDVTSGIPKIAPPPPFRHFMRQKVTLYTTHA